ncbi:hypothetical protein PFL02_46280 [Pseudomonas fluorescens]|nr:hypothetical protein PFL02_46280 [Pseudomonas fluorescens]
MGLSTARRLAGRNYLAVINSACTIPEQKDGWRGRARTCTWKQRARQACSASARQCAVARLMQMHHLQDRDRKHGIQGGCGREIRGADWGTKG